jgi:hypothetical protein
MHDTHKDIMTLDGDTARHILSVLDGVTKLVEAGEPKRDQMILLTHGSADSRMGFLRDVGHLAEVIRAQLRF